MTEVVADRSQAFLGTDQPYRATVRQHGRALVYDDRQDEALGRRAAALAHSTVWRWLSWLGDGVPETFRKARRLIREREPRSTLHRQPWGVSPARYRSETRRQTLQRAFEGRVVMQVFQDLFRKAVFPNLATGCGWR